MKNGINRLAALVWVPALVLTLVFAGCENLINGGNKDPSLNGTVTISGTARVGQTLTADTSALEGEGAPGYQWLRGNTADGEFTNIGGAGGTVYTLGENDLEKYIRVEVSRAGYSGTKTSPARGPVEPAGTTTWTAAANGANGTETSTAITFTFSGAVTGLTAADITVTSGTGSVTAGALSGEGTSWTLALSAVASAGDVSVSISKDGIADGAQNVAVYKQGEAADLTWTAAANGANGTETSTAITFTFSGAVTGLTAADITVTSGTGSVTAGALSGSGTSWTLALTAVASAGDVSVSINKDGIAGGAKTVAVYKALPPPDLTWTAAANGAADTATSTAITFTFSGAVTGLTAADITLTNGTGSATKGTLSGSGTSWTLAVTVAAPGDVSVAVTKAGIAGGAKTVAVHKKPELTDDVEFGYTENNSSDINLAARQAAGIGQVSQNYYFSVTEKEAACFTVTKTAAQTITLGGTDADKVTRTQTGTVEGSAAGDELEIFSTDFNDITRYFGGERNFTLTVSEDGKQSKTVNVNLAAEPDIDDPKCTVFTVTYPAGKETLAKTETKDDLVEALKWIDEQTASGTGTEDGQWKEYLVRLEKDEEILKMGITCKNADYVKIRLRGAGEERKISHDDTTTRYSLGATSSNLMGRGLLNVGTSTNGGTVTTNHVALQIEDRAALDGKDTTFNDKNTLALEAMVSVWENCRFIMEEGSKITRFKARGSIETHSPIVLKQYSAFFMKGGEISDTTLFHSDGVIVYFYPNSSSANLDDNPPITFSKTGGVFRNTRYNGSPASSRIYWLNKTLTVAENDSATQIVFTTPREYMNLAD